MGLDYLCAGDVGGTNSRFMLYEVDCDSNQGQNLKNDLFSAPSINPPGRMIYEKTYSNEGVEQFEDQFKRFISESGICPVMACIAIAGPVNNNCVDMTNRGWQIDGHVLQRDLGIAQVQIINDFVGVGYGLLTLSLDPADNEVEILHKGEAIEGGVIAALGSGTGLGETFLTKGMWDDEYTAWATEGGHAEFAPRTDLEWNMVKWMKDRLNTSRISVERVVSGIGIPLVYEYLAHRFPERVIPAVHSAIENAGDMKGKVIAENAHVPGSLCEQVLEKWAFHYGSEAGNQCLKLSPLGGLFLAGGMTPKLIRWLRGEQRPFLTGMNDKGRVSPMIRQIPVYAVLVDDIGTQGAYFLAYRMLLHHKRGDIAPLDTRN